MSIRLTAVLILLVTLRASSARSETVVETEAVASAPSDGSLGTGRYAPRERESGLLSALPAGDYALGDRLNLGYRQVLFH